MQTENFINKPLPSSDESEKVVLGTILLENGLIAEAVQQLKVEDFYSPTHRRVFAAMIRLFDLQKPIDPILLGEELKREGALDAIGGITVITNLTFGIPSSDDISEYLRIIREKSSLRQLIRECASISAAALAETEDASVVLEEAESRIYQLVDRGTAITSELIQGPVRDSIDSARRRGDTNSVLIGLSTGLRDLDNKLQGYRPGQYIVTAGRPGIGKTSLAVGKLYNVTTAEKVPGIIFSLEMSKEEIADRVVCSEGSIDSFIYRAGRLTADEWIRAEQVRQNLTEEAGFYINDNPTLTTRTIRAELRRLNARLRPQNKRIGYVVVDHVGLMRNEIEKRGRSREGEVSEISKTLKAIAREFDCVVNALSQLNRGPESRSDHRPTTSDLRESGSLEQDADVVELLFREDNYIQDTSAHTNVAEIIIGKNRNGPTGVVKVHFAKKSTKFSNLSDGHYSFPVASYGPDDNITL